MATMPVGVETGLVTGRFIISIIDGEDADQEPEIIPASGKVVFTSSVEYVPAPNLESGPVTFMKAPIVGVIDDEGYLATPDPATGEPMYRGVKLVTTSNPMLSVQDWTWSAEYQFERAGDLRATNYLPKIDKHNFLLTTSGVDLTRVVKVPASPGYGLPQAEAAAIGASNDAETAATQATVAVEAALRAEQVAGATDTGVATLLTDPATETGGALADALAPKVSKGDIYVNARDYGAKGDGVTDDTLALNEWVAAGGSMLTDGIFRTTTGLSFVGDGKRFTTRNAVLLADGENITAVNMVGNGCYVSAIIDGASKANYGVKITGNDATVEKGEIRNIYSETLTARALEFITDGGCIADGIRIENIKSVGDTTPGNNNGSARAIQVTGMGALATKRSVVKNNFIEGILGEEGDAIQLNFAGGSTTLYASAKVDIVDNRISNVSRRFIKVQGSDVVVKNNSCTHDGVVPANPSNAIDVMYSENVLVEGNVLTEHPLLVSINTVSKSGYPAKGIVVKGNLITQADDKDNPSIFMNYLESPTVLNNTFTGGTHALTMGYTSGALVQDNQHSGGDPTFASFNANGSNTGVLMKNNVNMNTARSKVIGNIGTGAQSDGNISKTA